MNALRLAFRRLRKTPGMTLVAIGTLALCIGANLAIFAVVDAVLVRALPFPEGDRLVSIINSYPGAGVERAGASIPNYFDRRDGLGNLESVALIRQESITVGEAGSPARIPIARVTPEFFRTLRVPLAMGESFTDEHLLYGDDGVAILTDAFWRSYFNADPEIVGRTFFNDGLSVTVIGVLPPDFRYLSSDARFFRPAAHEAEDRQPDRRHNNNYQMIGRLAPGATLESLREELDAYNASLLEGDPLAHLVRDVQFHTRVLSLREDHVQAVKPILLLLQGAVLFLLLIGGVNLANLLLVRAGGRVRELAIRRALGAAPRHVAVETFTEVVLLALAGGLLGLLVGAFGIDLLRLLGTEQLPLGSEIRFDGRVAAVAMAGALLVGVCLSIPIYLFNLHQRLQAALQSESRGGTATRAAQRVRHTFIVVQVGLAFVLLSGAGLLGLSLRKMLATPTGMHAGNVLTGALSLPWKTYPEAEERMAFVERLLPELQAIPGVSHAALSSGLPFSNFISNSVVLVENFTPSTDAPLRAHYLSAASADYWSALGIPLIEGRFLTDADNHGDLRACVVDRAFAERYWPGESPIGRRLTRDVEFKEEEAFTVVGVVGNVKQREIAEEDGHGAVYFPYRHSPSRFFYLVLRTDLPPPALFDDVRQAILRIDPELPVDDLQTMRGRIDNSLLARRSPAILAAVFAGVALLLVVIGTYGVLAYAVGQRTREIGVRMALGARPGQVRALFLKLGAGLFLLGLLLGIPAAWGAGRAMRATLFEIGAFHPAVFLASGLVLAAAVFLAILLPSGRAARVNPTDALRAD